MRNAEGPGGGASAESLVVAHVENELRLYRKHGYLEGSVAEHTERWARGFANPKQAFIREGDRIAPEVLRDFRRLFIFAGDNPIQPLGLGNPLNLLLPDRLAERAVLRRCVRVLEDHGFDDLLRKHPSPPAGNPHNFEYRGYTYTHRWFKQVYMLGLVRQLLGERLPAGFVGLDIGSAYGIFASLLHQEYPGSHQVLVDLPEQLLLASYFLRTCQPDCRIASIEELSQHASITRDLLERYDFVLMPPQEYERIASGSIDLISSFAALGELKRSFFDYYVSAPAFRTARFLATANPIVSAEMFEDSDLTVLDLPAVDRHHRLHFRVSPAFFQAYGRVRWRRYLGRRFPVFFEFVGELGAGEPGAKLGAQGAAAPGST